MDGWGEELFRNGIAGIPVDGVIAARATLLTEMHGDPGDRMITGVALEGDRLLMPDASALNRTGQHNELDVRS